MKDEVSAAARWWAESCHRRGLNNQQLHAFRYELEQCLLQRFDGHWHPQCSMRGSAFRAVLFDAKLDPSLEAAAMAAGIQDLQSRLPRSIMWINPGEVRWLQLACGDSPEQKLTVFSETGKGVTSPTEWNSADSSTKPFIVDQSQAGGGWVPPQGMGPSKESVARYEISRAVHNHKANGGHRMTQDVRIR